MWLSNFEVVLRHEVLPCGSVQVEDGMIAEIIDRPVPEPEVDGNGMLLLPGLIDLHGDALEREIQPQPHAVLPIDMGVVELDKRHAACGVTTGFAAISFAEHSHGSDNVRSEDFAHRIVTVIGDLKAALTTDLHIHARFEVNHDRAVPILRELVAENAVDLVSLNDHTPGQGQYRDMEYFVRYHAHKRNVSLEEARAHARQRVLDREARSCVWEIVSEVTALARQKGIPIASHDDDTPEKVALMQSLGAVISEFPVTIEAAHEARRRGMHTVMGAPNALRGQSNSGNMSARSALRDGGVDVLASDYHPAALLRAALFLAEERLASLPDAIALITDNPANAVGLDDRGAIAVGRRADFALVDRNPVPRVRGTMRGGRFIYSSFATPRQFTPMGS